MQLRRRRKKQHRLVGRLLRRCKGVWSFVGPLLCRRVIALYRFCVSQRAGEWKLDFGLFQCPSRKKGLSPAIWNRNPFWRLFGRPGRQPSHYDRAYLVYGTQWSVLVFRRAKYITASSHSSTPWTHVRVGLHTDKYSHEVYWILSEDEPKLTLIALNPLIVNIQSTDVIFLSLLISE